MYLSNCDVSFIIDLRCSLSTRDIIGRGVESAIKGGGGLTPDFCENTILRYELAMMARTFTNNLRVVLVLSP